MKIKNRYFWTVTICRVITPLFIFLNPFIGWTISSVFDAVDGQVWPRVAKLSPIQYHLLDKTIDTWLFLIMLLVSIKYGVFWVMLILFIHRLVGQIFFWITENEKFILFFPNVFEVFWIWLVAFYSVKMPTHLLFLLEYEGLSILLFLKLIQELVIHGFGRDTVFPWFRKRFSFAAEWMDKKLIPREVL